MILSKGKLPEKKMDIAFLGKEGKKSTKKPIRTTTDFSLTVLELTKGYAK